MSVPIIHRGEVDRDQAANSELKRISSALHLPDNVKENAMQLYHASVRNDIIRGSRPIKVVMAAAVYASCRQAEMPTTFEEIAALCGRRFNLDVFAVYQEMVSKLDLKMPLDGPEKYVPRYVSVLGLSAEVEESAMWLLREAKQRELIPSGSTPTSAGAAAVYFAAKLAGEPRTLREVAKTAGALELTIRKRYKELLRVGNTDTDP